MRNAMAGSACRSAFGWFQSRRTIVPGFAWLPPANLARLSDVMPGGQRMVHDRRGVERAGAYGVPVPSVVLGSICSSAPQPCGEIDGGAVGAVLVVERADDAPARPVLGERRHARCRPRCELTYGRILEHAGSRRRRSISDRSVGTDVPVSIAVNVCAGMRALKSAAVSVAYLFERMPTRAAIDGRGQRERGGRGRIARVPDAARKESRLHGIAESASPMHRDGRFPLRIQLAPRVALSRRRCQANRRTNGAGCVRVLLHIQARVRPQCRRPATLSQCRCRDLASVTALGALEQHRVAIAEKAIARRDRMRVRGADRVVSRRTR